MTSEFNLIKSLKLVLQKRDIINKVNLKIWRGENVGNASTDDTLYKYKELLCIKRKK